MFASGAGRMPLPICELISAWMFASLMVALSREVAGVIDTFLRNEPRPMCCAGVLYSVSQSKYALLVTPA